MALEMAQTNTQRIQAMLDFFRQMDGDGLKDYMTSFAPHISLASVDETLPSHSSRPHVVLSYTVQPEHCNSMGNMHGGAVATLFDFATSLPLAIAIAPSVTDEAKDPVEDPAAATWRRLGVSRTLAVTYVRPTPCDTPVLIECEMVHAGRTLSSLRGVMRRRSDGAVLATCEHGKVQVSSKM